MARVFDTPDVYRGPVISRIKRARQAADPRKRDLSPSVLDFGPVRFVLARHFGFCYGVENAIEIAWRVLAEHPDRRVFFLSEMIHNPRVNGDLVARGVRFLFTPDGRRLIDWDELTPDDIVVVPAFGTTLEMQERLAERGIDPYTWNTTCPFVEKVWKRSAQLGAAGYTVVIHGKAAHEETRATFSHSVRSAPTVVVRDIDEAETLDLERIGVVNQTTMLATETRAIAERLRAALVERWGEDAIAEHFADTSDTLCYATNENQNATYALIERGGDVALVVGGYNSSNTSHLVELCARRMPTYFVSGPAEIRSPGCIRHFDLASRRVRETRDWLPSPRPVDVVLTCGASCPDATLDEVLRRVLGFFEDARPIADVLAEWPEAD